MHREGQVESADLSIVQSFGWEGIQKYSIVDAKPVKIDMQDWWVFDGPWELPSDAAK